jgi:hypothetical protein
MSEASQAVVKPRSLATANDERPAIHVAVAPGLDDNHFRFVAIGAEEDGVPCRLVSVAASNPVAMAYEAATSSRFGVGVGVSGNAVVVHELHMPAHQPVITFDTGPDFLPFCRLAGSNAARLIIRLPFRFELEPDPPVAKLRRARALERKKTDTEPDPALVKAIAKVVARIIQERGLL